MQPGAPVPQATGFAQDVQPVEIAGLAADGPFLLCFYLYDWTDLTQPAAAPAGQERGVRGGRGAHLRRLARQPLLARRYAEQQWLTFPLLSDWSGQAVRAFGVAQNLDGLEDTPVRSCFLIDREAVVRGAWRYGDDEVPDVEDLLRPRMHSVADRDAASPSGSAQRRAA